MCDRANRPKLYHLFGIRSTEYGGRCISGYLSGCGRVLCICLCTHELESRGIDQYVLTPPPLLLAGAECILMCCCLHRTSNRDLQMDSSQAMYVSRSLLWLDHRRQGLTCSVFVVCCVLCAVCCVLCAVCSVRIFVFRYTVLDECTFAVDLEFTVFCIVAAIAMDVGAYEYWPYRSRCVGIGRVPRI